MRMGTSEDRFNLLKKEHEVLEGGSKKVRNDILARSSGDGCSLTEYDNKIIIDEELGKQHDQRRSEGGSKDVISSRR